ncbi:MarR family winged helix-turn-helix transcriptional regulator [Fulvimarina endophytica]|nr:MarR family transcriptional regulator [Fulvimarina endophytica]
MSGSGTTDDVIVELMSSISRQFRSELRQASASVGGPATPVQHEMLAYVGRHPGTGIMGLAELARRDKAQVTRTISELEDLELVIRERSASDRRATRVRLSESGEAVFREVLEKRRSLAAAMLGPLRSDERDTLSAMLAKMRSALADS